MSEGAVPVPVPAEPSEPATVGNDDQTLCDAVRAASDSAAGRAAFAELYARYKQPVLAQALVMTADWTVAEDLVSETFTRVLRALSNGNGPTESVLGYLLVSLRSEVIRTCQAGAETVPVDPHVLNHMIDEPGSSEVEGFAERDQIGRAYATLSDDARRVIWLLDVEGMTAEAASERLGMPAGTVRVTAHRARKKLAAAYLQQYVEMTDAVCGETANLLGEYVRGELRKRDTAKVEQHLHGCPQCTTQTARLRDLGRQLRAWAGPLLVGSGFAAGVTTLGDRASAAAALTPAHARPPTESGQGSGSVDIIKVARRVRLIVSAALIATGAIAFLLQDASLTPVAPTIDTETGGTPASGDSVLGTGSAEPQPSDIPSSHGQLSGAPGAELHEINDHESPNWQLRD